MSAPLYALLGVTGLTDVGYRFMDDAGAWDGARVTAGVDETDAADGTYYVAAPTTPGTARSVHWNSSGTPTVKATEVFATLGDVSSAAPTAVEVADAVLARNIAGGSSAGRTVAQAVAFLRNKWAVVGGVLTVYATDDTTVLWTATIQTDAAGEPIIGTDPA